MVLNDIVISNKNDILESGDNFGITVKRGPPGRDSGNNFFVPKISDGSGTFPFLLLSFLFFVPKRFQKRKNPLFKKVVSFRVPEI